MITIEQAKQLKPGQMLYHTKNRNADKTPQRWRVNGKVQTWKTRPNEVKVPIKNGLKNCDYLTEDSLHLLALTEQEANQ
jgi:hypothetical protein